MSFHSLLRLYTFSSSVARTLKPLCNQGFLGKNTTRRSGSSSLPGHPAAVRGSFNVDRRRLSSSRTPAILDVRVERLFCFASSPSRLVLFQTVALKRLSIG